MKVLVFSGAQNIKMKRFDFFHWHPWGWGIYPQHITFSLTLLQMMVLQISTLAGYICDCSLESDINIVLQDF